MENASPSGGSGVDVTAGVGVDVSVGEGVNVAVGVKVSVAVGVLLETKGTFKAGWPDKTLMDITKRTKKTTAINAPMANHLAFFLINENAETGFIKLYYWQIKYESLLSQPSRAHPT